MRRRSYHHSITSRVISASLGPGRRTGMVILSARVPSSSSSSSSSLCRPGVISRSHPMMSSSSLSFRILQQRQRQSVSFQQQYTSCSTLAATTAHEDDDVKPSSSSSSLKSSVSSTSSSQHKQQQKQQQPLTPERAIELLESGRPCSRRERQHAFQVICSLSSASSSPSSTTLIAHRKLLERATRQLRWWGDEDALRLLVKGWSELSSHPSYPPKPHHHNGDDHNTNHVSHHPRVIPGSHVAAQLLHEWISRAATDPPPMASFRVVLKALAKEGQYRLAERVLQQLIIVSKNRGVDRDCYHRVLQACQTAGALEEALVWWHTMKEQPSPKHDNNDDEQQQQQEGIRPNVSTFKILLQTFVSHATIHNVSGMGELAFEFFQQEKSYIQPDGMAYNICLNALAQDGNYVLAHELFSQWLEEQSHPSTLAAALADPIALRTVLKACSKAATVQAAEAAEELLSIVQSLSPSTAAAGSGVNAVDARAYTTVVAIWCKLGQPERAHLLLQELMTLYLQEQSYISSQNNKNDSFLDGQQSPQRRSQRLLPPDAMSFRTVIGAYSHRIGSSQTSPQQAKELATKAHQLFEDMHQIMGYTPNLVTCNTIINCWAQAREPERAEDVLQEMPQWDGLQPDIVTYNTIIGCHAKLGNVKACVQWLSKLSAESGSTSNPTTTTPLLYPPPNTRTVTCVITALSKIGSTQAAQDAEQWFLQMQDWQSEKGWDCAPNVVTLNALLSCWARVGNGARAEYILREYQHHFSGTLRRSSTNNHDDGPNVAPNLVSYNTVIRANQHNIIKVQDLLQELIAIGLTPNESTMTLAKKALLNQEENGNGGTTSSTTTNVTAKWKDWERRFFYAVPLTTNSSGTTTTSTTESKGRRNRK